MPIALPLTGSCQCRAVRYAITAAPFTVYACHCTECQRQSGSAFALSLVAPREAVRITAGAPKEWVRRHESGRLASCLFCPDCGTRLYHEPHANLKVTIVKPGTLDDASWLHPVGHIWTRSAQAWVPIGPEAITYEMQPPNLERLSEAFREQQKL